MPKPLIVEQIKRLDRCNTAQELARALKPILQTLAAEHIAGEASIQEHMEGWKAQFDSELTAEIGSDMADAIATTEKGPKPRRGDADEASRALRQQVNIPASLRSIYNGTHPSLNEK